MRKLSFIAPIACGAAAIVLLISGARAWLDHPVWAYKLIGFSLLLAAFSFFLLRARESLRINLSVTVAILAIGTFGIETVLAVRAATPPELGPDFDTRSPMQVVREMRAAGQSVQPALFGSQAFRAHQPGEILPLCGISTSTTVFCNESGRYVLYESDEHGFNNPSPWPETAELVIVGDSYAHGNCVPRGQDLAGRLRAKGYPAISLGCAGAGPVLELATLIEYGLELRPKTVVWLFYEGNDAGDLYDELKSAALAKYLEPGGYSQDLSNRQKEIDSFWARYLEKWADTRERVAAPKGAVFRQIAALQNVRGLLGLRGANQTKIGERLATVLSSAAKLTKDRGVRFVFVYVPSWQRFHDVRFEDQREEVLAIARTLEMTIVDFAEILRREEDVDRFFPNRRIGHFNADGYALLAESIARAVQGESR